jgi:hypothetical protein
MDIHNIQQKSSLMMEISPTTMGRSTTNVVFFFCGSVVGGFYIHTVVLYTIHICNTMLPSTIDHQPTKGFAWFCHYQPFEQCISDTIKVQESFSRTFGKT